MTISIFKNMRAVAGWFMIAFAASSSAAGLPDEATMLVDRYFSALKSGDTSELSSILGGNLRDRLQAMQGNADYAAQLASDNASSSFVVTQSRLGGAGLIEVDYVVSDESESVRKRLFLRMGGPRSEGSRIVAEQVIP